MYSKKQENLLKVESIALQINFSLKMVTISTRSYYKNTENFQGYISRILQHFATKFWNFTILKRFFPGISFFSLDLPRSKISLLCKLSIETKIISTKSKNTKAQNRHNTIPSGFCVSSILLDFSAFSCFHSLKNKSP